LELLPRDLARALGREPDLPPAAFRPAALRAPPFREDALVAAFRPPDVFFLADFFVLEELALLPAFFCAPPPVLAVAGRLVDGPAGVDVRAAGATPPDEVVRPGPPEVPPPPSPLDPVDDPPNVPPVAPPPVPVARAPVPVLPRPPPPPPPPPVREDSCGFFPEPLGRPLLPLGAPPPKRSSSSSSSSSSPSLTTVASVSTSSSSSASSALSQRRSL
jgi:hypothetical protein